MAEKLPYQIIDFDNHSIETPDCFSRFMPKNKIDSAVQPVTLASGRKVLLANHKIVNALENDLDQAYVPGSLAEMLRQRSQGDAEADSAKFFEDIKDEYVNRDARLTRMDEQQIERALMFPGGWGLLAEAYLDGIDPLYDNLRSFNRWIDEDWGYAYKNRIYAPAMLSLRDLDRAVAEVDAVLSAGAKFILLPAGPAYGRSPGDPYFDPFWARVNEANANVAFHISEFHYQANVASQWGWGLVPPFQFSAWQWQNTYGERPITDTLSALIFDNLFHRFPGINVVVSEFGAEWVPHFTQHMDKSRGMGRNGVWLGGQLPERPSRIFNQHVKVVPYPEDDTPGIASRLGTVDSLVMGSDWPHAEGLAEPADFYDKVAHLGDENRRKFLRDNALSLLTA